MEFKSIRQASGAQRDITAPALHDAQSAADERRHDALADNQERANVTAGRRGVAAIASDDHVGEAGAK